MRQCGQYKLRSMIKGNGHYPVIPQILIIRPHFILNLEIKTRAMRRATFTRFGRLTPTISSAAFNYMYNELTGDQSAATNINQAQSQKRVKMVVDMEDPEVLLSI